MKLILKLAAGLIAIAVLGYGIYFGPSQIQTLSTAPGLPGENALREIMEAENSPTSVKLLLNASQVVGDQILAHTVFVAEWENGDRFLIDLGMEEETATEFAEYFVGLFGAGEDTFFGDIAQQLGDDITSVKGISLTHLHADHIQGIEVFCRANPEGAILLQSDTQQNVHNYTTRDSAKLVEESCLTRGTLEGDKVLTNPDFPGIGIVPIGGHSPGAAVIAVAADGHLFLFAGDTTFRKEDLVSNTSKPIIYTTTVVPENRFQNARLRKWLAELDAKDDIDVIISHDLQAIDQVANLARIGQ